jgi:hypothetical protein
MLSVCVGRWLGGKDGGGGGEGGTQHQPYSRLMAGSNSALAHNAMLDLNAWPPDNKNKNCSIFKIY